MTSHEMLARSKKASLYANHLRKHGITALEMELFASRSPKECEYFWEQLAKQLKLNPPSEKTRKLICDMLREG